MNFAFSQVNSNTQCHFAEVDRVGWSTAERGAAVIQNGPEPSFGGSSAAWNAEAAHALARLKGRPEAQEWAEGKREVNAVAGDYIGRLKHAHPVVDHPAPGFRGIK